MKTDAHTRLDVRLRHDLDRYFESGKKATDEERSVLHAVLRGIENALDILVHLPVEHPNGTIETVMATRGDLRPTPEVKAVERWNDRPKLRLVVAPDRFVSRELTPFDDLTENEREFLTALVDSDFFADTVHDKSDPDNLMTGVCWISCIPDFSDERRYGGVIGSLVKKELIDTNGEAVRLIRKGAELYAAHIREGVV